MIKDNINKVVAIIIFIAIVIFIFAVLTNIHLWDEENKEKVIGNWLGIDKDGKPLGVVFGLFYNGYWYTLDKNGNPVNHHVYPSFTYEVLDNNTICFRYTEESGWGIKYYQYRFEDNKLLINIEKQGFVAFSKVSG